jgi:hypothetical protein
MVHSQDEQERLDDLRINCCNVDSLSAKKPINGKTLCVGLLRAYEEQNSHSSSTILAAFEQAVMFDLLQF